jgi:cytochrome b6-f complex iron-sulfur subunit
MTDRHPNRSRRRPIWKRDFPYEAAAEEEVTRREFARYLVAGAGAWLQATSASPRGPNCAPSTTGEPRAIVDARRASRSAAPTCSGIRPTPTPPCCSASATPRSWRSARSAPTSGCVVFYEADEHRWHCPCHEGNFDAETGDVISGPPLRPLGRIDVETRDDGMIWALGRSQES